MISKSCVFFALVLSSIGALAKPDPTAAYQSNNFNCYNGGYASSIPVLTTNLQTSTVENPPITFPSFIPHNTVSEACHCLQSLVRPQYRKDVITVPAIDRISRTVTTPVVKTINCGGSTRLTTLSLPNSMQSRTMSFPEGGRGSTQVGSGTDTNAFFSGGNAGLNSNSLSAATGSRAAATLVATPTSVFTYQASTGGGVPECQNALSGIASYTNGGRIITC